MATLGEDLAKLAKLKDAATKANAAAKIATLEKDQWERHCFNRMEAEECEGHRSKGKLFTASQKTYAQIQDRDAFLAWAQENEPELVVAREKADDLHALVRRLIDDGQPLPPGIGFYIKDTISVRKAT